MSGRSFTSATTLPYAITEASADTSTLLVFFPKLRPGGAPPQRFLSRSLTTVDAHQLRLGADEDVYVGPRRELRGLRTAVDLIGSEAQRLGVPRERIVSVGTSMGGVLSLMVGLSAGTGHIVAGGAPVRMGRQLRRFDRIDGPTSAAKAAAAQFLALGDNGDGATEKWFDRFIGRLAAAVTVPTRVDLFVSPTDTTYRPMVQLSQQLSSFEAIDCRLTEADYERHGAIGQPFSDYALEMLSGLYGSRAVEPIADGER